MIPELTLRTSFARNEELIMHHLYVSPRFNLLEALSQYEVGLSRYRIPIMYIKLSWGRLSL